VAPTAAPQQPTPAPTTQPAAAPAPPAAPPAGPAAPAVARSVSVVPAPASFRLDNFRHQYQTWNNCGPATITMAMSHFGRPEQQAQAAPFLKPNADDKNVSPNELVDYVRSIGMQADYRVGGDLDRLKLLLTNGVPVVVETWFTPAPNDGMGHYRLLVGYDDTPGRFVAYDSYEPPGTNVSIPYGAFDADWRVFNRTYIPVYTAELAPTVAAILGQDADDGAMWERALGTARQEVAANGNDAFGWYNVGASLVALNRTGEAVQAFDRARALRLPWRMLWYQFQPFEAYLAEGRLNDVMTLAQANLQQTNDLEESHYFRGKALQAQGQSAAARGEFQAALRANPRFSPASYALSTLA
jgi:tetratricopeptide (TPR) repeat protein